MKQRVVLGLLVTLFILVCPVKSMVAKTTLNNPRIEKDSSMDAKQKVTWDCVWFGSYPQIEIVDTAKRCGTTGRNWAEKTDYKVDSALYGKLDTESGWDSNGVRTIDGVKYKRIKKENANRAFSLKNFYNWEASEGWHYFRYDKIKWRVLNISGDQIFLLSDLAIDAQIYNIDDLTEPTPTTWEKSTIRSWLNGYSASVNTIGKDYTNAGFINTAFNTNEQNSIMSSQVVNKDSIYHGIPAGADAVDKVFLLSESEVFETEANKYGFVTGCNTHDEARRCKSSTYAKAMGADARDVETSYRGNTSWWLRSPGSHEGDAADLMWTGGALTYSYGYAQIYCNSVRPALVIDASSSDYYSYAGTVCSDEMNYNLKNKKTVKESVKVTSIKLTGISKKIARGKKVRLSSTVRPLNAANKNLKWTSSNKKLATVTQTGWVKVARNAKPGKTVKITATSKDGSGKKAIWKIRIMKGAVKKISVKGYKKTLKAGKIMKLKAKVKTTKGKPINKKVKWTSLSPKYASVTETGKVKAKVAGKGKTVKIKVESTDGTNKSVIKKIKIK